MSISNHSPLGLNAISAPSNDSSIIIIACSEEEGVSAGAIELPAREEAYCNDEIIDWKWQKSVYR